jgi:hypothetical protein
MRPAKTRSPDKRRYDMNSTLSKAIRTYKERGLSGAARAALGRLKIPATAKSRWKEGVGSEANVWDSYFRTRGL